MVAGAQGIDVSSYQAVLTKEELKPYAFAYAKASEGASGTDPNFARNWTVLKDAGIHRGAYHELRPASSASGSAQAAHFLSVVKARGLDAGDILVGVASDYSGVTDAEVKEFCDAVKSAAPRSPVLVYSDLSVAATLTSCTEYDLWVAWPSDTPPASVRPWKTWRFWQWGTVDNVDRDAYQGTATELSEWIKSVADPTHWTYGPPQDLKAIGGHTSVRLTWEPPVGSPQPPSRYQVYIYEGTTADVHTIVHSYPRTVTAREFTGGSLEEGKIYTAHVLAEGPNGTHVAPDTYASVTFKTG